MKPRYFLILLAFVLGASACRQGEGQRCQINDDCESGLICTTQGICGTTNQTTADAGPTPDARQPSDANTEPDGPVSVPDAATVDAATPDAT